MLAQGKTVGIITVLLFVAILAGSYFYTQELSSQRDARVSELLASPAYESCLYDESTCPQVEQNLQVPNLLGIGIFLLGIILAGYLFHSDNMQKRILEELRKI